MEQVEKTGRERKQSQKVLGSELLVNLLMFALLNTDIFVVPALNVVILLLRNAANSSEGWCRRSGARAGRFSVSSRKQDCMMSLLSLSNVKSILICIFLQSCSSLFAFITLHDLWPASSIRGDVLLRGLLLTSSGGNFAQRATQVVNESNKYFI